jgi:hypothetical protein
MMIGPGPKPSVTAFGPNHAMIIVAALTDGHGDRRHSEIENKCPSPTTTRKLRRPARDATILPGASACVAAAMGPSADSAQVR